MGRERERERERGGEGGKSIDFIHVYVCEARFPRDRRVYAWKVVTI